MRSHNGNAMIKGLVILGDFVLMNIILIGFIYLFPDIIPATLHDMTKLFALLCNMALALSEVFFSTIICRRLLSARDVIQRVSLLVITQAAIAFFLIRLMWNMGGMFRFTIIYTPVFLIALITLRFIERSILKWYRQKGGNTYSVVFVGNDQANLMMYNDLVKDPTTGYRVLGYFSNGTMENAPQEFKKIGSLADLDEHMKQNENTDHIADELFCALSHDDSERIVRIMDFCNRHVIRFYYVPRMFGNFRLHLKAMRIGNYEIFTNLQEPLADPVNIMIKRTFDVIVSGLVCLCMLPFIPFIALIIKIQSPGPLLFKQKRTGMKGEDFECYKFRSMHVNSKADTQQATENDPRKFPFGNFMRKCNLDEFPQFFNVLLGDMSIVGPRPHMLHHTEVYSSLIDKYMVRHFSKPGITGWAQVTGFRGETKELWQMEERVKRDIWYIENWSMGLDLKIIWMTFITIFKHDNHAY